MQQRFLPGWVRAAAVASAIVVAGCGERAPGPLVRPLVATCRMVTDAEPLRLHIDSPAAGLVRIEVRGNGIELAARLERARGETITTASPVFRYARNVLVVPAGIGETLRLHVASRDSAAIRGTACVSMDLYPSAAARPPADFEVSRSLSAAGIAYAGRRWPEALHEYSAAARGLDALHRPIEAAETRLAMAQISYSRLGESVDALAVATAAQAALVALPAARAGALDVLQAELATIQAKALMESSNAQPADRQVRALLRAARRLMREAPDAAGEIARIDTLEGYWSYLLHDEKRATADFEQVAATCRALGDATCEARARQNLAMIAQLEGHPATAIEEHRQALGVLDSAREPELAADIYDNLSVLEGTLGMISSAELRSLAAMRLHATLGDCDGGRRSLDGIGSLLAQVGDTESARRYLDAAVLACPKLLAQIARLERPAARSGATPPPGDECVPPAPATLSREGAISVTRSIVTLATLALTGGDVAAARACLAHAHTLDFSGIPALRVALAAASADLSSGDHAAALARLGAAAREADGLGLPPGHSLRRILDLDTARATLLAGRPRDAWAHANRAMRAGAGRADTAELLETLRVASASLQDAGLAQPAIALLRAGGALAARIPITELGPEASATFVATQHAVFSDLTDLLALRAAQAPDASARRTELAWEALGAAEAGRSRTARTALIRARRNETGASETGGAERLIALRNELAARLPALPAAGGPTAEEAGRLANALEGALAHVAAPADAAEESAELRELPDYLARLTADATVVEYAAAGRDLVAFVIHGSTPRVVRLGARPEIARRASRFDDLLQDPDTPAALLADAAAALAELIWWPLELPESARILIVPDDSVDAVPFAALPWGPRSAAALVLDRASTVLLPSLLYAMARERTPPIERPGGFVVLGDPIFAVADWRRACPRDAAAPGAALRPGADWTERLAPLPGAAAEARDIGRLVATLRSGSAATALLGCEATAGALRRVAAQPVSLLHLATHARVDAARPRLSALALTPEPDGNGLRSSLGYAEIVGLQLRARLVVLGACDTSRGLALPGEGVLGPAQAFLQGGAQSVIGTLWAIDDARTTGFMNRLYRHLLIDRLPVAEAVRRTQAEFRDLGARDGSHFWAAFATYGRQDSPI